VTSLARVEIDEVRARRVEADGLLVTSDGADCTAVTSALSWWDWPAYSSCASSTTWLAFGWTVVKACRPGRGR
jgi:hypothetical protein